MKRHHESGLTSAIIVSKAQSAFDLCENTDHLWSSDFSAVKLIVLVYLPGVLVIRENKVTEIRLLLLLLKREYSKCTNILIMPL